MSTNPFGISAPTTLTEADLAEFNRGTVTSARAYRQQTTSRCHECSETAEPGLTRCQQHREAVAAREAARRQKETP